MIKFALPLAFAATLVASCTTPQHTNDDGSVDAKLGQTVNLGGLQVTPLKVLDDSRCPMEARCVWGGRLRLSVRVTTGAGSTLHELATDQPLGVADGRLVLDGVMPPRSTQRTLLPSDYRFTLKFSGPR